MYATMERLQLLLPILCLLSAFGLIRDPTAQIVQPVCTEIGAFEIIDGTCKNYYICVDDGEKLTPVLLTCASSAIFDPLKGSCVPDTAATCLQTTIAPPTTVAPRCVRYGRFPIKATNCTGYYLCYWNGTDYDVMDNLTCPNALLFKPTLEKCVPPQSYTCPVTQG